MSPPMRSTAGWRRAPVWPTLPCSSMASSPPRPRAVDHRHPRTDIDSSGVGPHTITVASDPRCAAIGDCRRCRDRHQRLHRVCRHREHIVPMSTILGRTPRSGAGRPPPGDDCGDRHQPDRYASNPDGGILFGGRARFRPVSTTTSVGFSTTDVSRSSRRRRCEDHERWSRVDGVHGRLLPVGCAIGCITSRLQRGLRRIDAVAR